MGVGKSMKIFMEGMQNSMMSSGYTGKIVNTPMGPFKWDETTNSWINQNNGFSIPNISLQDLMMYDYGSIADETESSGGPAFIIDNCIYSIETLENRQVVDIGSLVTFGNVSIRNNTCPFNLSLKNISIPLNDIDNFEIFVSTDLGATLIPFIFTGITTNTVSISTSSMRIYIQPTSGEYLAGAVAQFQLINSSDNDTVIASLYQANIPGFTPE
jgi:hypothetical protein